MSQSQSDELVLKHLPLVRVIAIGLYESLPVHVDVDDLVHAGIMGLFDAAVKYNGEKQVSFHAYAKHRIRGAILKGKQASRHPEPVRSPCVDADERRRR